ncbi:COP9 signalosome complex subunit 7a [Fulvia fulva]|nr:COP9 signalosome complex subunit 7a [Fulvia fulva]WPV14270.1 COP9 signalosome complex subunit 7a [Fulvia fulva]
MDASRAINALAPFVALAKSATAPRAAAGLITQATSAQNTYVFAELLQQPNIKALAGNEQHGSSYELLKCFAWGTWETYKATPGLPELSDAQALKLRQLSILTIASQQSSATSRTSNLSYQSLCTRLDLTSSVDLEHLITQAMYSDLITGTLNPASQTVVITSVAPLRDLAPGSVQSMISELAAWSGRCDWVLAELEAEIKKVKADAERRAKRESRTEKQIKAVTDAGEQGSTMSLGGSGASRSGHNTRGAKKDDDEEDGDMMDLDDGKVTGAVKKGGKNILQRFTRGSSGKS